MIVGLKFRISSDDLRNHLMSRVEHHRRRAKEKEDGLPELKQAVETVTSVKTSSAMSAKISNSYHADPQAMVENVEQDIKGHRNTADTFEFFANHLLGEDYELQENDLRRIEFIR